MVRGGLGGVGGQRDEVGHRIARRRTAVAADDELDLRLLVLAADRLHRGRVRPRPEADRGGDRRQYRAAHAQSCRVHHLVS